MFRIFQDILHVAKSTLALDNKFIVIELNKNSMYIHLSESIM